MATRTMSDWQTSICRVVSREDEEEILVRGHRLENLVDELSFSGMMFLMLSGQKATPEQTRVLDALLVASMEHGIAPPSMVARCFASYGTSIQAAVGGGILAFGDRMGGLGEQLACLMTEQLADLPSASSPSDETLKARAATVVEAHTTRGLRLPGYGIPLHGADPRAPNVLAVAEEYGIYSTYCRFAQALADALTASRGGREIPMNLDGVSAAVILDLGFSWQTTRLFLLTARSVSMGAHYLEEQGQDSTWRHIPAADIEYLPPL
jgi:citrate synthase